MKPDLLEQIKVIIAEEFSILPEMLIGPRQSDYVSTARHVLSVTLYGMGLSCVAVGKIVGKDHSTVLHSIRVYHNLCTTNDLFNLKATIVEKRVKETIFKNHKNQNKNE